MLLMAENGVGVKYPSPRFSGGCDLLEMDVPPSGIIDTLARVKGCAAGVSSLGHFDASGRSITFTLTDTDVLDCSICLESLSSPIFQCNNGHVACSSCCVKVANKCPSCSLAIGVIRCRALEKVLESVRLTCKFSSYGCKETFGYSRRPVHEISCPFVPYNCPHNTCSFIGSSRQLSVHFTSEHPGSVTSFSFNTFKSIDLGFSSKFHVLCEENQDALFLLTSETDQLGSKIAISSIGPFLKRYDLELLAMQHVHGLGAFKRCDLDLPTFQHARGLMFKTVIWSIQAPSYDFDAVPYIMIPKGFFGSEETMKLKFRISRENAVIS